jgi:hypothetical protein
LSTLSIGETLGERRAATSGHLALSYAAVRWSAERMKLPRPSPVHFAIEWWVATALVAGSVIYGVGRGVTGLFN